METAAQEAQHLSAFLKVNTLSISSTKKANKCGCYGKDSHNDNYNDCWFKVQTCRNCGKKGHIGRVCRSKKPEGI